MSIEMEDEVSWTARRKSVKVLAAMQSRSTGIEAARHFDLLPSEVVARVDKSQVGIENAEKGGPEDIREQHEAQLKALQEAAGEAVLEPRA